MQGTPVRGTSNVRPWNPVVTTIAGLPPFPRHRTRTPRECPEGGAPDGDKTEGVRRRDEARLALVAHARRQIDQVDLRLLRGETIPHEEEKVFSIFEGHTRWISKGKAGTPVQLGVPVGLIEDPSERRLVAGRSTFRTAHLALATLPPPEACRHPLSVGLTVRAASHAFMSEPPPLVGNLRAALLRVGLSAAVHS